jgi:two-component system response regulator DesR
MGDDTPMRILVADNDARVRTALQTLLAQEPGLVMVRESSDLGSIAAQFKDFRPDVLLLDWELPGRPAAALLVAMGTCDVRSRIIVLSKRPESEDAALAAGADGFVSKSEPPERFLSVFRGLVDELMRDEGRHGR